MPKIVKKTYRDREGNLKIGSYIESYFSLEELSNIVEDYDIFIEFFTHNTDIFIKVDEFRNEIEKQSENID